jgi:putative N6-adenine-specific DNA methylase
MFKGNWQRAQLPDQPPVRQVDAMASKPPGNTQGIMLLNPPYGERLVIKGGRGQDCDTRSIEDESDEPENRFELNLETGRQSAKRSSRESLKKLQAQQEQDPKFIEFLRQFGQHLKDAFGGWNIFVLTADMALPGQLRIKESKRTPLFNGPLECRLFKFEMHQKRPAIKESGDQ